MLVRNDGCVVLCIFSNRVRFDLFFWRDGWCGKGGRVVDEILGWATAKRVRFPCIQPMQRDV